MRAVGVVIAVLALVGSGPVAAMGATPAAAHQSALAVTKAKRPNITFGAGPANSKKPDGRTLFTYDASPGGQINDHIAVLNLTHHAETLQVYTVDVDPQANGGFFYPPRSAPRTGAGGWVSVGRIPSSGLIRAKPRSTTILPVHLQVPSNASPGDHVAAVIVSLTGKVKGSSGQRLNLEQRVATRVLVRVSGTLRPQLSIANLSASYDGGVGSVRGGSVTVHYTVRNTGNAILGGSQQVSIHGMFGSTTQAGALPALPVLLPGGSYSQTVHVKNVFPEFRMTARVRVVPAGLAGDVNPGIKVVTASVSFWALPWLLIAILLLILALVGWTVWRRWRDSRPAQAVVEVKTPEGAVT